MKANGQHITIHQLPGTRTLAIYCGHCTGALRLALPVPVSELVSAAYQFEARHNACKAEERPTGPF